MGKTCARYYARHKHWSPSLSASRPYLARSLVRRPLTHPASALRDIINKISDDLSGAAAITWSALRALHCVITQGGRKSEWKGERGKGKGWLKGPKPDGPRQSDRGGGREEDMPQSLFDWMSYGHHVARPPPPPLLRNNYIMNRIKDPRSKLRRMRHTYGLRGPGVRPGSSTFCPKLR